eukprot:4747-Heterococcus_DN1.PRE.2
MPVYCYCAAYRHIAFTLYNSTATALSHSASMHHRLYGHCAHAVQACMICTLPTIHSTLLYTIHSPPALAAAVPVVAAAGAAPGAGADVMLHCCAYAVQASHTHKGTHAYVPIPSPLSGAASAGRGTLLMASCPKDSPVLLTLCTTALHNAHMPDHIGVSSSRHHS